MHRPTDLKPLAQALIVIALLAAFITLIVTDHSEWVFGLFLMLMVVLL